MLLTQTGAVWKTNDDSFTPSAIAAKWSQVQDFTGAEHPANSEDCDMMVGFLNSVKNKVLP